MRADPSAGDSLGKPPNGGAEGLPVLLCLPHAGGAATAFRHWPRLLKGVVRVVALEPPGRGARRAEPLATTMTELVDDLRAPMLEAIDGAARVALLGHSLGALVARELADVLDDAGHPPAMFVALGRNGPTLPSATAAIADLPDERFLEAVLALGGVPREVRDEPELLALFVEPLRADLRIAEHHLRPRGARPLACPVLALQGADDPVVSPHGVRAWRGETSAPSSVTWCPGGHFFLHDPDFLRGILRPLLVRWLGDNVADRSLS